MEDAVRESKGAFLSRLCGGEDWAYLVPVENLFLSRLCGGEGNQC